MGKARWVILGSVSFLVFSGLIVRRAAGQGDNPLPVSDATCSYFGSEHEKVADAALKARGITLKHPRSYETVQVMRAMSYVPPGGPTYGYGESHAAGSIDSYIWADFQKNSITPAPPTTDWEFVRRVTLDLTGRIPTPAVVLNFVNSTSATKRNDYIDSLLASSAWVDKWTMFYGDLFQNVITKPSTGVNRFPQGRNAFYSYINNALTKGTPYNQIASDLISTANDNNYTNGPINFLLGSYVSNGPSQDTFDAETASVADTFLGITYVNCLLCHNGAGHLTQINLWGSKVTRYQAWQLSAYLSHTQLSHLPVPATDTTPVNPNIYYWQLQDNTKGFTTDYALNTTIGNRPSRVAPAGCKAGQPCYYVPPQYIFNGDSPSSGQTYRASLASEVTSDFQFARAAVNYLWAQFFGMGIVDPPDTFDLARLDPNNPPPAGWTLQPTNPDLLNALATHFVQSGYNVKALMREIVTSQTYQLSSRYNGAWQDSYEPYFARKYVRRLWGEEIYDAVAQSSGYQPAYTMTGFTDQGYAMPTYAMQFPDTTTGVSGGPKNTGDLNNMLGYFLRGNRDDQPRKQDGSILQALALMNNPIVEMRTTVASYGGNPIAPLISQNATQANATIVNNLYLAILSRYPSTAEMTTATAALSTGTKSQAVQNLAWSLYNKVDFVFNY
jgi:hypothetical protein